MVKMALHKLSEPKIIQPDDGRKAAIFSKLLVMLCSDKEAQPISGSGSVS